MIYRLRKWIIKYNIKYEYFSNFIVFIDKFNDFCFCRFLPKIGKFTKMMFQLPIITYNFTLYSKVQPIVVKI